MISQKENALRAFKRTGDVQWVPVDALAAELVIPAKMLERPPRGSAGGKDWFGCSWIYDENSCGFAPDLGTPFVLDDVTKWRDVVKFPNVDAIDWEAEAEKDLAGIDTENKLTVLFVEAGPFERTHHLMGFSNAFLAMMSEPEEYKALVDAIADYKVSLFEHLIPAYKPDVVFAHDDLGSAKGPLMSLDMYRELIKPAHVKIGTALKKYDVVHLHHSCGNMQDFIPDLLETGATAFNPIQNCNDRAMIAKEYSDRASFWVFADSALSLYATEDEVRAEMRSIIDDFAPHKNVMVGCHPTALTADQMGWAIDEAQRYGGEFYK